VSSQEIGRNDPCPCNSGKKYKRCCGAPGVALIHRQSVESAESCYEHGNVCLNSSRLDEAIEHYRRAIVLKPRFLEAHSNLGVALERSGASYDALRSYRMALSHARDGSEEAILAKGNYEACLATCRNRLFNLLRTEELDPAAIFEEHRGFARVFEAGARLSRLTHSNLTDPERRLRIGYVSPDFRKHSVAHFIEPIFVHHDRGRVEVFAYYSGPAADDITHRIRASVDHWCECTSMSDEALAGRVRHDCIDILVDLAGHTDGNRLPAFALKPAPVQITYLGYPATTGFTAMDYRVSDSLADPEGAQDALFVERPLRIAPPMLAYRPAFGTGGLLGEQEQVPVTRVNDGRPTFGSFNHVSKINDAVIGTWARLLIAMPDARLLIKSRGIESTKLLTAFERQGVEAERLLLKGRDEESLAHMSRYNEIDVALDTFPYNGVTTSLEAMWMGVPVITLAGDGLASRMGVMLAATVGHPEWIATSPDEYVERAVALAADRAALGRLRASLRNELARSALMDASGVTRKLEDAYREAWRRWCEDAP
jgi:protein O-GlcNAc transferase